jgi:hypothetical protein
MHLLEDRMGVEEASYTLLFHAKGNGSCNNLLFNLHGFILNVISTYFFQAIGDFNPFHKYYPPGL